MKFLRRLHFPFPQAVTRYTGQFSRNAKLFLLSTVIGGITFSGFQLFFNFYVLARGFDRDFLGLINAIPAGAALLVGVPMGVLSDRIGRRRAMIIGVGIATVGQALLVTSTSSAVMIAASAVQGVASSLYFLSMAPFMMRVSTPRERTLLFSLNFGLQTLSGSVGSLLAGQLPAWFGTWLGVGAESAEAYRAVLLASIVGGALMLLPVYMIREVRWPGESASSRFTLGEFKTLVRPDVLRLAAPNFIIGLGAATLIPYMNVFFKTTFAVQDAMLGVLFSLSAIVTGLATVVGPRIAERMGSKVRAVVLTQGISLIFLLLIGFSGQFLIAGFAFLIRGALMNMSNPLYSAYAMEAIAERERGAVNSVMALVWEIGWTVGPYLSGLVQARYGFAPLFLSTAILYGGAVVLTWAFHGQAEERLAEVAG